MKPEKDRAGGFPSCEGKPPSGRENGTLEISEIVPLRHLSLNVRIPPLICGVIEVRGQAVPIMDLRKQPDTQAQCVVVVYLSLKEGENVKMGLIVDSLDLVLQLKNFPLADGKGNMELSNLAEKLHQAVGAWTKRSASLTCIDECKVEKGN